MFGIIIPTDPRLPGGGGGTLEGLYNVTPTAAVRLNDNFQTLATTYVERTQVANSINMNVTARPRNGLVLQGGFNIGETASDSCDLRTLLPETAATNPWCDTSTGWVKRVTALGIYTVPKIDVLVSGTLRSDQGGDLAANWVAPNSATVGLNRPFAGIGGQTITVNLIEPGTFYGDRVNQIDLRFAKILRFGRTRFNVGFDIYNVDELGAGADLQPELRAADGGQPRRLMADADVGAAAAVREVQRADRLLRQRGWRRQRDDTEQRRNGDLFFRET